jgi:hypothetical protein
MPSFLVSPNQLFGVRNFSEVMRGCQHVFVAKIREEHVSVHALPCPWMSTCAGQIELQYNHDMNIPAL